MFRPSGIITLTTDFGGRDGFVGMMHGVILGLFPAARVVDLAHDLPAHDVDAADFLLGHTWHQFPVGTVHVAVVDPGVGSARRAVAVTADGHAFVGPDNGVLTTALARAGVAGDQAAVELREPCFWRPTVSQTFHGRDVFAPVAAHLAAGVPLPAFGPPAKDLVQLPLALPHRTATAVVGAVRHVDRFGNLITNISAPLFREVVGDGPFSLRIGRRRVTWLAANYSVGCPGELLALFNSFDLLELAVNQASAAALLRLTRGAPVMVEKQQP